MPGEPRYVNAQHERAMRAPIVKETDEERQVAESENNVPTEARRNMDLGMPPIRGGMEWGS